MQMRTLAAAVAVLAWSVSSAAPMQKPLLATPTLTADQVIARNVTARGGVESWRKVGTMTWLGHVEGSSGSSGPMPFVLELGRPNKTRFEIATVDRRFARIFDGTRGWRVRPAASGAPEVKPFSGEEVSYARDEFVIDGPLIDYESKGVVARLVGLDEVDGRKAYLLELTLPSGASRRHWIDAETYLDVRSDRPSTSPLARGVPVSVYYGDYRSVDGLMIPFTIEIRAADGTRASERLVIERVALNPKLPDRAFAKPAVPWQRHAVVNIAPERPPVAGQARANP
ncbi:MAG TPA: hypothetical protein PLE54_11000 [Burkholderiaceae bacterium]|nr:hypothetical protein [Burkholderiaceae bacterium]HQR71122.1 hypothetical protein [Burkholderiaceae bacterium]